MLVQDYCYEIYAFRKVLVTSFVDVQVESFLQQCLQKQKWRGTNLAVLPHPDARVLQYLYFLTPTNEGARCAMNFWQGIVPLRPIRCPKVTSEAHNFSVSAG